MPGRPVDPPSTRTATWAFVARSESPARPEETQRLRAGLEAALRAGHGVGARFTVRIGGDRRGTVEVSTGDLPSERWVERALLRAYDPGQWRRVARSEPPSPKQWVRAYRRALPGELAAAPVEVGGISRTLLLAFSVLPSGVVSECRVIPVPSTDSSLLRPRGASWVPEVPRPVSVYYRSDRSAARSLSNARTLPTAAPVGLWRAEVRTAAPLGASAATARRAIAATEEAWRLLDGAGIRLRRVASWAPWGTSFFLAESELLGALPGRDGPASGPARRWGEGLALGRSHDGSPIGVPVEPHQGRHLAVVGETGMGKSSLLIDLSKRAARLGGVVVLDPLGETARRLRTELAAEADRLIWIAPGEEPPVLNALERIDPGSGADPVLAERRVDDIVHSLRRVRSGRYADSPFWGPRLEEMLGRAVRAAAAMPGGTLVDAHTLLATGGRTRQVVSPEAMESLHELNDRMRERPEDADGARRLLYEIVRNPTLATMLCARSPSISPSELVAPGRLVLLAGNASYVGESAARYLFAVYLALLWSALLTRETASKTFVVLDEAQWFAHESLAEMLRLARRSNVHVVLGTQSLASLPEGVRDAVWANVADFVAFRGSPDEARDLARAAGGTSSETLLSLPRGEAMLFVGKGENVVRIRTARLPSAAPTTPCRAASAPVRTPSEGRTVPVAAPARRPDPAEKLGRGERAVRPPAGLDPLLAKLREEGATLVPGELLRVSVERLRSHGDPEAEAAVRRLGAELGRAGAIVRSEKSPRGTIWHVDPRRIPPGATVRADRSGEGSSFEAQPS